MEKLREKIIEHNDGKVFKLQLWKSIFSSLILYLNLKEIYNLI